MREEIGVTVSPDALAPLGRFAADAAHEAGFRVEAEAFRLDADVVPEVGREIAEARWISPASPDVPLAALSRDQILPLAR